MEKQIVFLAVILAVSSPLMAQGEVRDTIKIGGYTGFFMFHGQDEFRNDPTAINSEIKKISQTGFFLEFLPIEYVGVGYQRHNVNGSDDDSACGPSGGGSVGCGTGDNIGRSMRVRNEFMTLNLRLYKFDLQTHLAFFYYFGLGSSVYTYSTDITGVGIPPEENLNGKVNGDFSTNGVYFDWIVSNGLGFRMGYAIVKVEYGQTEVDLDADGSYTFLAIVFAPQF